jgi:regulator of sigma E protease
MDFIIGIIAFVVMLSVIVILHELGHFLVAKHFGVYCKEFSIGMGPCLYQRDCFFNSRYSFWRLCNDGW